MLGLSSFFSQPEPPPALGLFRGVCASAVMGELLHHWTALRYGDASDYPLVVYIDPKDKTVLRYPGLQQLKTYISQN
jgi:hypothetical protein